MASHGLLIPGVPGRDEALVPYPHDPAKAKALLDMFGYLDRDGDGVGCDS